MEKTLRIFEDISENTLMMFSSFCDSLSEKDKAVLEVTSYGGCCFSGTAISQKMQEAKSRGIEFTAKVYGLAASSAADIVLSCDRIGIAKTAALMIHSSFRADGEHDEGTEIANDAQLAIIRNRVPDYSIDELENDRWFRAEEALSLGLVDYIFDVNSNSEQARLCAKYMAKYNNNGGFIMPKKEIAKAEEIKKEELIEEEKAEEMVEEVEEEKKEEIKEEPEKMPSIDDVLEEIVKQLEDIKKRLSILEGGEVEAECGEKRENARMKAVFDRIQAISKPAVRKEMIKAVDPKAELEKFNALYKDLDIRGLVNKD